MIQGMLCVCYSNGKVYTVSTYSTVPIQTKLLTVKFSCARIHIVE